MNHSQGSSFVLMVFGFVFFALAAVPYPLNPAAPSPWRSNLIAAGLACWIGSQLF